MRPAPSLMSDAEISEAQARLRPLAIELRTRHEYRKRALWWQLEARRGYSSSGKALEYAANMRWAGEWAQMTGPGTWLEIKARAAALPAPTSVEPTP